ncbi:MAG: oligopeptide transporter, OPT family [Candidatus Cloacimonetes bacterium]|nr:oligopeptide transporter, OPT family [Candidatus Cloacimonadota bacterium]
MAGDIKPRGGLSPKAYIEVDGNEYEPYVPHTQTMAEFTLKAIVAGCLIGVVFGAANAYLGLKVGLTVSASIPAAVMAVAIFKVLAKFARPGTILETNMVQTVGSCGESLAAGVCFTIPALFLWGFVPAKSEIFFIALFGGLLGVLFMIPLRSYLIVREHGKLPYPEGTACAEVLVASQEDSSKAKRLFQGLGIGALYQSLMHDRLFGLWNKEPAAHVPGFKGAEVGAEVTPELLGVGYIIGPKIAAVMLSGGILGWMVLIPLISFFGEHLVAPLYPSSATLIRDMAPIQIWSNYVRYIGAGGVAFAGIFALIKSIPVIVESFKAGLANMGGTKDQIRTQRDLPMKVILWGSLAAALSIGVFLAFDLFDGHIFEALVAGVLIVIFSFFFVTVSSRIVGLLGSSSNPVSGMTIATLLLTCLIFMAFGLHELTNSKEAVLVVGAFVCIAAAIAGDSSQDLKTGFLVGATPKNQQIGEILGVLSSALSMGFVMSLLSQGIIDGHFRAPQANLMKLVVDGVLGGNLPWVLVLSGVFIAAFIEMLGVSALAFAVGLYLPMSLSVPIMIGGLIRWWVDSRKNDGTVEDCREAGVLYSSGLIAGAALTGVLAVGLVLMSEKSGVILETISRPGIHSDLESGWSMNFDGKTASYIPVKPGDLGDATKTVSLELVGPSQEKIQTSVSINAWSKTYLSVKDGAVSESSMPQSADTRAIVAFLLLCASLVLVVRKP